MTQFVFTKQKTHTYTTFVMVERGIPVVLVVYSVLDLIEASRYWIPKFQSLEVLRGIDTLKRLILLTWNGLGRLIGFTCGLVSYRIDNLNCAVYNFSHSQVNYTKNGFWNFISSCFRGWNENFSAKIVWLLKQSIFWPELLQW